MKNNKNALPLLVLLLVHTVVHSAKPLSKFAVRAGSVAVALTASMLVFPKNKVVDHEKKVLIYHTTATAASFRSIKKYGLCCGNGLAPEAFVQYCKDAQSDNSTTQCMQYYQEHMDMCKQQKKAVAFADQYSVIFFKPEEPGVKELSHFAVAVDPKTTYVYNLEHRARAYECNPESDKLYRSSRVLLADYLAYVKRAEEMVNARPDVMVLLDPETAEPFYLEKNDARKDKVKIDGRWVQFQGVGCSSYNGEVIIDKVCIPPEQLKVVNSFVLKNPVYSTPVVNKASY